METVLFVLARELFLWKETWSKRVFDLKDVHDVDSCVLYRKCILNTWDFICIFFRNLNKDFMLQLFLNGKVCDTTGYYLFFCYLWIFGCVFQIEKEKGELRKFFRYHLLVIMYSSKLLWKENKKIEPFILEKSWNQYLRKN